MLRRKLLEAAQTLSSRSIAASVETRGATRPEQRFSLGRWLSTGGVSEQEERRLQQELNDLFAQARDDIEAASESASTTYFREELDAARESTKACFEAYEHYLSSLEEGRAKAQKEAMDKNMRQLQAELEQVEQLETE